ncbi:unnamed protein product [Clavelina lepadiformis]|uniref:Uncharacterized protein n=1 Tax=Clavelina lepadiformis TaxID=159417 RepID=A0ABP0GKV6_CLALP
MQLTALEKKSIIHSFTQAYDTFLLHKAHRLEVSVKGPAAFESLIKHPSSSCSASLLRRRKLHILEIVSFTSMLP